ncbi:ATP-binding protein [Paroceanicella profunda]|uniref:ATP-binding protein n=1 Tax=Paroceanicella profunda TaxID=2579971 RepID=A0A5B8FXY4_9RHOB|nr:ATP-binding protein [Paroceanicella profunda]QDL92464.1 ATP-binding protein [Paroceanicella profunda]
MSTISASEAFEKQSEFGRKLSQVLSPSRPLHSEEFLRGRQQQLDGIRKALFQPGRHVLIHGFRGVGKSSLAQTAAYVISGKTDPIIVGCDESSTLESVIKDILSEACNTDPSIRSKIIEKKIGFANKILSAERSEKVEQGRLDDPTSINECVSIIRHLGTILGDSPVIVIDEFDLITNHDEQINFTNFVKQISDRHIDAKFIFCGIGESVDAIMAAHASSDRYFHTVGLERLPFEARDEIVSHAAETLGLEVDRDTMIRIARISDGFPHYIHFISEKLFWIIFESEGANTPISKLFERAMSQAAESMEMKLRAPYERATQKYSDEYAEILWAAADGHELKRSSANIFKSYEKIMRNLDKNPISRERFNSRMNSLKKESHGCILTGSRQGWYEFTEKMIRGYVRLKAEQAGIELEADHPTARPKGGYAF